jgi:MFS family permease
MSNDTTQYKSKSYLLFIAVTTALGGFIIGVVCCILNATIIEIQTSLNWPADQVNFRMGMASSLIPLGSFVGAILAGYLSDRIGRRGSLMTADCIIISGFAFTYCEDFTLFCLGRMIEGIACGMFGVLVPIFIREIAPSNVSGKMVSAYAISANLGSILVYCLTFGLPTSPDPTSQWWKYMYAIPAVIAIVQLLMFATLLKFDTPKYYLTHNKEKEARDVINSIYKDECVEDAYGRELQTEKSVDLFHIIPKYKYQLILCMFLYFSSQYMGLGMLGYYSTYIFIGTSSGDEGVGSPKFILQVRLLNLFLSLISCPTSAVGSYLVDKIGRKLLLLIGCVTLTLLLFCFAACGLNQSGLEQRVCFVAINIVCGLSYGVMLSLYTAELVPPKGISIINTWDNFNQLIITFLFPIVVNSSGRMASAFVVFGLVSIVSFPIKCYFVKETKNKGLHEIYQLFQKQKVDGLLDDEKEEDARTPDIVPVIEN